MNVRYVWTGRGPLQRCRLVVSVRGPLVAASRAAIGGSSPGRGWSATTNVVIDRLLSSARAPQPRSLGMTFLNMGSLIRKGSRGGGLAVRIGQVPWQQFSQQISSSWAYRIRSPCEKTLVIPITLAGGQTPSGFPRNRVSQLGVKPSLRRRSSPPGGFTRPIACSQKIKRRARGHTCMFAFAHVCTSPATSFWTFWRITPICLIVMLDVLDVLLC